jgi:chromosome segregation ATPase
MRAVYLLLSATALRFSQETRVPSFESVITMLNNLVDQIENEESSDEADYNAFKTWFTTQSDATSSSISGLTSRLQELTAILADLRSRQHALSTEVNRLNGEIDTTQQQMDQAKSKRTEEHNSFVQEQLDFDNSIKACDTAVEMLKKYYGDGKPKESTRPSWMSLLATLKALHVRAAALQHPQARRIAAFLQSATVSKQVPGMRGSTMFDEHQDSTGEALSIVAQVKDLGSTFMDDKQSSIDQEEELNSAFQNLMAQKAQQLSSLTTQRNTQQAILTKVNQELGENENAEATAKATLQDEQTFLSAITAQEQDTTAMYEQRVADRAEEKKSVAGAIAVLQAENPSLLQRGSRRGAQKHKTVLKSATAHAARRLAPAAPCRQCHSASLFLRQQANSIHSELLATAAMATGSGQALAPVVTQLNELVTRLDEQQRQEEEHKEWCEKELSETAKTKGHHEALVEELKSKIEDTKGTIEDKKQSISDTADAIKTADEEYAELKDVRAKAKADFEAEHADYVDAIQALNQAIDLLGDFYRSGSAMIQSDQAQVYVPDAADRAGAPSMGLTGSYEKKGGAKVVSILRDTRLEFTAGKESLEKQEEQQVKDFEASTVAYQKSRADLVDAGNRLSAELQSAELALTQQQGDLKANEDKVMQATAYLAQVGGSCNVLIDNFPTRTKMRAEEKESILKAIGILQAAV